MKILIQIYLLISLISCAVGKDKHHKHHKYDGSMNEKYLRDDLDVKLWQERFENRDRDVYKNRNKIVAAMKLKPGQNIADVGAGTGFYLKLLHDKVAPTGEVHAVEISPGFVKYLNARAKHEKLENVKVVKGGLDKTGLAVASMDKIFVCDTYHHFDHPGKMLTDFRNVLKKNGELIIVDFNRVEGKSRKWVLGHIKKNKSEYISEIEAYGFKFSHESKLNLDENFMLHFKRI